MSGPDWDSLGRAWWAHVRVLAGDNMQGRETGSPGYQRAAAYVAEQFQAAGLEPAGVDGYRQSVDFRVSQLDEPNSSLTLIRGGTAQPLQLRDDAQFAASTGTVPDLEAEVVFVGYGLDVPEHQYSDLPGWISMGRSQSTSEAAHPTCPVRSRRTISRSRNASVPFGRRGSSGAS